eukprot:4158967-Pleurochrysis_carterae.AAC.2
MQTSPRLAAMCAAPSKDTNVSTRADIEANKKWTESCRTHAAIPAELQGKSAERRSTKGNTRCLAHTHTRAL